MTAHLLLVTLGPVQEFIAQARRTRDLWYGSHLLSGLARAAARTLIDGGADLVFPALAKGDRELQPCLAPLRSNGEPPLNVANKLVAEVPAGVDPQGLARMTREAVMRFWREKVAAPVKENCADLLAPGIHAVWDEQVDTFPEFMAAWVPLRSEGGRARRRDAAPRVGPPAPPTGHRHLGVQASHGRPRLEPGVEVPAGGTGRTRVGPERSEPFGVSAWIRASVREGMW